MILSEQRLKEGKFAVGIMFWEDLYEELVTDWSEFAKHYPQFVPPHLLAKAGVKDAKSVLQTKAINRQYQAAQDIHILRHDLTSNLPDWPELEMGDVESFIAEDFSRYENRISEILKSYGLEVNKELKDLLIEAKTICSDGKATVEITDDGPYVSPEGHKLANRLYDVLDKAAEMARNWLQENLAK